MKSPDKGGGRRSFLQQTAGILGAGFLADETLEAYPQNTNTNSKPSDLKITDMRVIVISRAPMTCPVIRIDTNQGISRPLAKCAMAPARTTRSS